MTARPRWLTILAWALYDFAVTVFAMNVISRYFGLWVTETQQGADWMYSVAFALSTSLAALSLPFLGAYSDRLGRRVPLLRLATLLCVGGTAAIGLSPAVGWGLVWFGLANIGCQVGGLFYDALLPTVSHGRRVGLTSGLGVCLGYVGSATGLLAVQGVVQAQGYAAAFLPTAGFILLAALPSFWLIREPKPPSASPWSLRAAAQRMWRLVSGPTRRPGIGRFLLGCFFGINAINTVVMFMAVYAKRTVGLHDAEIDAVLLFSTAFAIGGAFLSGWLADRVGPRRCLLGVFGGWCAGIILAAASPTVPMFWVVGPLIGVCLGATWASARTWLVALSPPEDVGAVFGLFGLVGRASSNVGPLLWGRIVLARDWLGPWTDRLALGSLLVLFVIGMALLRGIPDARVSPSRRVQR